MKRTTKKKFILDLIKHKTPETTLKDLAETHNLDYDYLRKVSSEYRRGHKRNGTVPQRVTVLRPHGLQLYESVPECWYSVLRIEPCNSRNKMKQLGRKGQSPCSVQFFPNGSVLVHVYDRGWRVWLRGALQDCGWSEAQARSLVESERFDLTRLEVPVRVSGLDRICEKYPLGGDIVLDNGFRIKVSDQSHPGSLEFVIVGENPSRIRRIEGMLDDLTAGMKILLASGIHRSLGVNEPREIR